MAVSSGRLGEVTVAVGCTWLLAYAPDAPVGCASGTGAKGPRSCSTPSPFAAHCVGAPGQ